MFFFDIYWVTAPGTAFSFPFQMLCCARSCPGKVFISVHQFKQSVMVSVATGAGTGETVPMLIRTAKVHDGGCEAVGGFGAEYHVGTTACCAGYRSLETPLAVIACWGARLRFEFQVWRRCALGMDPLRFGDIALPGLLAAQLHWDSEKMQSDTQVRQRSEGASLTQRPKCPRNSRCPISGDTISQATEHFGKALPLTEI